MVCQSCKNEEAARSTEVVSFQAINAKSTYIAGETIVIHFRGSAAILPYLRINNAFGSAILQPTTEDNQLSFYLPKTFTEKSGVCTWQLVYENSRYANGELSILPHPKRNVKIESYLGPPSIIAGAVDYTMLVTAPVDIYDNPLVDSTKITVKKQYNTTVEEATVLLKNGVAWKNIYSTKNSGRLLIAATADQTNSKELTAIVSPANATDFKIEYHSNHNYADGNQVITFLTDVIKDEFKNTVSDGTLVSFVITNAKGMRLQTSGTTINGIAEGRLLHPDEADKWTVRAYVTGAAQSNTITLDFEPALKDYRLTYSSDGRTISISQMHSFMGQMIPDGIPITLEIKSKKGILLDTLRTTSRLGGAKFVISKDFYPNAAYELTIRAAGIVKTKTVQLQ